MSIDDIKAKLKGKSFSDLITTSKKGKKQRLISDVEFLTQEQYEFLEQHTQQKFFSFMEQYWAEMIDADITCRTFDGEVINVDRGSIRVIDKRWKGASHCICGKAIRYEYWIQHYGPIGSVHIVEHTNLDKTLVRDITKGYKSENTLRTDIVRMLADLKEDEKGYDEWADQYDLSDKMAHINNVGNEARRNLIIQLCDLKLPLPEKLRHELALAKNKTRRMVQSAPVQIPAANNPRQTLIDEIDREVTRYNDGNHRGVSQYHLKTLVGLKNALGTGKPTPGQINYARRLLDSVKSACNQPTDPSWANTQKVAKQILDLIVVDDVKNSFARSLQNAAANGDLSQRQLDCIFMKKSGRGRAGLFYQYPTLMNSHNIVSVDPTSYQA